jgi:class 3 adenylate cyclase/tetratricopeptide (TPR) repeat protein
VSTCPSCGRENPDDARFCNACGSELIPSIPRSETRKIVTIVFCDITGSTALGERLDPESLRAVMSRYFDAMREAIERHGGTVEKFIGDAVMAVFGIPQLHEDDALRAARAACEMRDALAVLNKELERDRGVTIATRTGVNTGEVVTGDPSNTQSFVTGTAVNVAARLEQAAEPGQILIGEATFRLTHDLVVAEPIDPLSLKGKSAEVLAYQLLEVSAGTAIPLRSSRSPMVGRERELAALQQAFDRTVADDACFLFTVLGAAGEGKSRLVEEFVERLGVRATILRGRCLPYGDGITYWPVAEAVKEAVAISDFDDPGEAERRFSNVLVGEERAPVVSARLAEIMGVAHGASAAEETHWAIRRFFEVLAVPRPLVVVFDDIQWGERTFLDLIDHIADWSRDAPILLICMARPDLLDLKPDWAGGKINATTILLRPLDDPDCARLIENLLGSAELAEEIRTQVAGAAEGNPLFVEQMLSMLIDEGVLRSDRGTWVASNDLTGISVPPTISALMSARLDRLDAGERAVIEAAAVMGKEFIATAVRELAPESVGDHLEAVLGALTRKELIGAARSPRGGGEMRFRHLLIRDAAYQGIPKSRRADLHERFAAWLEAMAGDHAEEQEEILGYHLEQAYRLREELGPLSDADRVVGRRAATRLAAAGRRALARADMPATVSLLSRAASLLPIDDADRIAILPELGYALAEGGDRERGQAAAEEARALAEAAGDERLRAHAMVRLFDITAVGSESWVAGAQRDIDGIMRTFERADDDRGLARAWKLKGTIDWERGLAAPYEVALERALGHARKARELYDEADILFSIGTVLTRGPTPVDDGIRRCQAILTSSGTSRVIEAYISHALAHLHARRREFDEARSRAATFRDFLHDTGQVSMYWFFTEVSADVESLAGNGADAVATIVEGAAQLERIGERNPLLEAFVALHLYDQDDLEGAERCAGFGVGSEDYLGRSLATGILGKIRARRGREDEAERLATESVALLEATDFLIDLATALFNLGEVFRLVGKRDEARSAFERALDACERKGDLVSADRVRAALEIA